MSITIKKTDLRLKMYGLREKIDLFSGKQAGQNLIDVFEQNFDFSPSSIIASYWPIGSELDTRPLLEYLHRSGYVCALPCVEPQGIIFKKWRPDVPMIQGYAGIFEPQSAEILSPDILLIPLLAFDLKGQRLGYGKGHYDRYLETLRGKKSIIAIGVAFEDQKIETVPIKEHDQYLDFVLTEQSVYKFDQTPDSSS
jgi:5-formyltetrahydrofolate cyclo-ligase